MPQRGGADAARYKGAIKRSRSQIQGQGSPKREKQLDQDLPSAVEIPGTEETTSCSKTAIRKTIAKTTGAGDAPKKNGACGEWALRKTKRRKVKYQRAVYSLRDQ